MPQDTVPVSASAGQSPADIETMRAVVRIVLAEDSLPPGMGEVETLLAQMRGHMQLLIPDIEQAAERLPHDDVPRYCALACVGEARAKLSANASRAVDLEYAGKLARSLRALCDHYENLGGPAQ
ncbi:DUF6415 family natural product biosynthesis protein [Streptomyces aurantiacus]|uniref:Uncharacterized protein n=1 Tax=Streptomyces aurantiacus TaxID=47760 RepID=A0A7G1P6E8_9ACTN|nr:DUF6415 family natural product biosynthesis protein [Streptomyces aurantiacus]BCL30938.1 hypothetical protein GCM10017557_57970 [Streptomyces aurantiacus]